MQTKNRELIVKIRNEIAPEETKKLPGDEFFVRNSRSYTYQTRGYH